MSNQGDSKRQPESLPLMTSNSYLDEKGDKKRGSRSSSDSSHHSESSPHVSLDIDMKQKNPSTISKREPTPFPSGFNIDMVLSKEPKIGELESRKNAFATMFKSAIRNADIDCALDKFSCSQMGVPLKVASLLNESKNKSLSILQWSAIIGLDRLFPVLWELKVDISQVTPKTRQTIPMIAAQFGSNDMVIEILIASSNEIELLAKENSSHQSLIEVAALSGNSILVEWLLKQYRHFFCDDVKGLALVKKAFSEAIKADSHETVNALIKNAGLNVNESDSTGIPPLVLAIHLERQEIVELIVSQKNCDVNIEASTKDTPLMVAARVKSPFFLELLLKKEATQVNKITSTLIYGTKTALKEAAYMDNKENVHELLKRGAQVVAFDGGKTCNSLRLVIPQKKQLSIELLVANFMKQCLKPHSQITEAEFQETLKCCVLNDNSETLSAILKNSRFESCLEKFGGAQILWDCLMKAAEKGCKKAVVAMIQHPLTPTVTSSSDLTDLTTSKEQGLVPLHRLASTCLDDEIIQLLESEPGKGLDPNWLLIKSDLGKTVLEHINREEVLMKFLGLREGDSGVAWVEKWPRNIQDAFKHKVNSIDREILRTCLMRFPNVSQAILNTIIIAKGWGVLDDNLEIAINWKIINDTDPKIFSETSKYSSILTTAAKYQPQLLDSPVMKLLQRNHWLKMPVHYFRLQMLWALVLAAVTSVLVLQWKYGFVNGSLFAAVFVMGIIGLVVHLLQFTSGLASYTYSVYDYVQTLLYGLLVAASVVAFMEAGCKEDVCSDEEKDQIRADFSRRSCWFSFLILATWQNLFVVMQKSTFFGLYIIMFKNALASFIKITVPLLLLLFSFGITFFALYSPNSGTMEIVDFQAFVMKISAMTIGSVETTEMGEDPKSGLYNPRLVLAITFVIMVTVITFNLLTGLVIKDVNEALQHSKMIFLKLRIRQIAETEVLTNVFTKICPRLRKYLVFCSRTSILRPNETKTICKQLSTKWDNFSNDFMSEAFITDQILGLLEPKN